MKITVYLEGPEDAGRVPGLVRRYQLDGYLEEPRHRVRDCVVYMPAWADGPSAPAYVWGDKDHIRVDLRRRHTEEAQP